MRQMFISVGTRSVPRAQPPGSRPTETPAARTIMAEVDRSADDFGALRGPGLACAPGQTPSSAMHPSSDIDIWHRTHLILAPLKATSLRTVKAVYLNTPRSSLAAIVLVQKPLRTS